MKVKDSHLINELVRIAAAARNACNTLTTNTADGPKGRPTVGQLNRTVELLDYIDRTATVLADRENET